ncbi:isochorismatase hydrolase [Stemphylium lycopersici]|uniref:Isochorismatase hydrolase n=1 Tax=Stemphylium lycopersici TaxID=183478 RepID=A0A364NEM2_STELY|nr:isochorismatase family protein [Stemphylium lycopersici]RAR10914.1 isochorismatase hydrolase [Stemphylium lycopersici]RAR15657.1 isochorismatase hydrolase [Stemphylium lycopersici]
MRFFASLSLAAITLLNTVRGDAVPWERIDKSDALLLILDLQVGLFQVARDWDPSLYKQNIMAHAEIGKIFDLPVIMTTSADTGPNGPLPKEMLEMYPDAPLIRRQGEVNAWDNAEFQAAIKASGKKQIIVAGITTDVCTAFLALSLRAEGYSVFANVEASGTYTELVRDTANSRMEKAGVQLVSLFSIVCDLMRDWRSTPGAKEVLPFLDTYLPVYDQFIRFPQPNQSVWSSSSLFSRRRQFQANEETKDNQLACSLDTRSPTFNGKVTRHIVPARRGHAFPVSKGKHSHIVDLHCEQAIDLVVWVVAPTRRRTSNQDKNTTPPALPLETLSTAYTCCHLCGVAPAMSEHLYSNNDRRILRVTADTIKVHDMTFMSCFPQIHET